MSGGTVRYLRILTAIICLLLAWETAYRLCRWRAWVFPAPSHVLDATLAMLDIHTDFGGPWSERWPAPAPSEPGIPGTTAEGDGQSAWLNSPLITAQLVSGLRLGGGFVAALLVGVFCGALTYRVRLANDLLGPLFVGIQTLPSVCWVPLAVLIFGLSEVAILFVLFAGSFCAIALAFRDGLTAIPPVYRQAGVMLGARRQKFYLHVLLPASLPALVGSLRQGFTFAWRSLMGAELILAAEHRGLGHLLAAGRDFADVAQVVAVMAVMIGIGMVVDLAVFAPVEARISRRFGLAPG